MKILLLQFILVWITIHSYAQSAKTNILIENSTQAIAEIGVAENNQDFSSIAKPGDVIFRANGMLTGDIIIAARSNDGIILTTGNGNVDSEKFQLENNGKVSIGNVPTPGTYRLYVKDGILTEKLHIALANSAEWADYVFSDDYELLPLPQVESFIDKHHHLPNLPSAEDLVETGINVAKMDSKLLEKIEELTLYVIDLNKRIKQLEAELQTASQKID